MIGNVAMLLRSLQRKEMEIISRSGIDHAPTIGEQYEGLTASLLGHTISENLQLQVVTGFVEGIDSTLSEQIDCMLVRGAGIPIPYTVSFKWPVRDVLAVFEVKKTLFSDELKDAHEQLRTVLDKFWDYAEHLTPADQIDISPALYVYWQIVGEPSPSREHLGALAFDKEMIYRMLVAEQIAPLRIIFGYYGYSNEYTLRTGFLNFLRRHTMMSGYAGAALPSLIVCGQNSLIKFNGHPYSYPLQGDQWLCYASSSENPLLLLLNLILTKLSYLSSAPEWYGRDLSVERFSPLLWGTAVEEGDKARWYYTPASFTRRELEIVPAVPTEEWRPMTISPFQFAVLGLLGADGLPREALKQMAADQPLGQADREIEELVQNRLVGWRGDTLVFLTRQCATAFTPWGEAVAGDVDDIRLSEWIQQEKHRRRSIQ